MSLKSRVLAAARGHGCAGLDRFEGKGWRDPMKRGSVKKVPRDGGVLEISDDTTEGLVAVSACMEIGSARLPDRRGRICTTPRGEVGQGFKIHSKVDYGEFAK